MTCRTQLVAKYFAKIGCAPYFCKIRETAKSRGLFQAGEGHNGPAALEGLQGGGWQSLASSLLRHVTSLALRFWLLYVTFYGRFCCYWGVLGLNAILRVSRRLLMATVAKIGRLRRPNFYRFDMKGRLDTRKIALNPRTPQYRTVVFSAEFKTKYCKHRRPLLARSYTPSAMM